MISLRKIGCIGFLSLGLIFGNVINVNAESSFDINECLSKDKCVLQSNVVLDNTVKLTKDLTIDLNGHEFTANTSNVKFPNAMIEVSGSTLTIMDSKGNGKISSAKGYGLYALNGGKLVLNSGTVESLYSPFTGNNTTGDMNFEINGGTLRALEGPAIYMSGQVNLEINGGTLYGGLLLRMGQVTINGGIIDNSNPLNIDSVGDYYTHNGMIYTSDAIALFGGTYSSTNKEFGNSFNLTINGGTIKSSVGDGITLYTLGKIKQDMSVNINGGKITGINNAVNIQTPSDLKVTDQEYKVYNNIPKISINQGTFSSKIKDEFISDKSKIENKDGLYVVSLNKSINTTIDGNVGVTFDSETAFSNDYKLSVNKVNVKEETVIKEINKLINNTLSDSNVQVKNSKILATFDISVLNSKNEIIKMENGKYRITLSVGNEILSGYNNYKIVYIDDNGNVKEVLPATVENGIVSFETTHLSTYSIVGYNTQNATAVENPKTSDNFTLYLLLGGMSFVGMMTCALKLKRR